MDRLNAEMCVKARYYADVTLNVQEWITSQFARARKAITAIRRSLVTRLSATLITTVRTTKCVKIICAKFHVWREILAVPIHFVRLRITNRFVLVNPATQAIRTSAVT